MFRFRQLRCSFCRKKASQVSKLVAGPRVYICDACVTIATRIMNDPSADNRPPRVRLSPLRKVWNQIRKFVRGDHALRVDSPMV